MAELNPDKLPALPDPWLCEDGYQWMRRLRGGWYDVGLIGVEGTDLGSWPYVCYALYTCHERALYGIATYVEGDLFVWAYDTSRERDIALEKMHMIEQAEKNR